MCIAIYSPKGNPVPCENYLKNSFMYNPDGAGFAYNTKHNNVQIQKGYMDWDSFWAAFTKADEKYDFKKCGVLIHFRITTHGGTNPECCHPFPLVADEGVMRKTKVKSDYAVIHNGIIDLTSWEANRRQKMSDTMVFIEKYLSKIATNKKWFKNKSNFDLIYDLIDSKMAILNGYGEINATAGFIKDIDGNYYSNTSYKEARYKKPKDKFSDYYGTLGYYAGLYTNKQESNSKSESKNEFKVNIMRLKQGQMCETDALDYLEYDPNVGVYITSDDVVYMGDIPDENGYVKNIGFVGYGMFYDHYYINNIEFDPDCYTDEKNIDGDYYYEFDEDGVIEI